MAHSGLFQRSPKKTSASSSSPSPGQRTECSSLSVNAGSHETTDQSQRRIMSQLVLYTTCCTEPAFPKLNFRARQPRESKKPLPRLSNCICVNAANEKSSIQTPDRLSRRQITFPVSNQRRLMRSSPRFSMNSPQGSRWSPIRTQNHSSGAKGALARFKLCVSQTQGLCLRSQPLCLPPKVRLRCRDR